MFKPKAMSKVELIVPERDIVPVTEALADSAVFHLARSPYINADENSCPTTEWQEWADAFASLERRIQLVMEALEVDPGEPPQETPHLISPDVAELDIEHLEQESQAPVRELEEEKHRLEQLQRYVTQLTPIVDLDVDLGAMRGLRYVFTMLGMIPAGNIERLRSSLEHIPFVLVNLHQSEHFATVALFGLRRDSEILSRAARSAYLNPLATPDAYRGTPADAIAALKAGIERTRNHIAEYEATIQHLRDMRVRHLRLLLWRVRASRNMAETISRYGRLRFTYLVSGWVPTDLLPVLHEHIARASQDVLVEVTQPRHDEESTTPVALDNPSLVRAFQSLVTTYGQPRYGEVDPTPLIALTFPLIFGMMFGDVGHGLLLVLLGLLLASRRVRALHSLANAGTVVIACGIASTIFGVLYGSVFGFEDVLHPLWVRPLDNIMFLLTTTIGVGIVILSLGMVANMVNAAWGKHWGRFLFDHYGLSGLFFYWSLVGLGLKFVASGIPLSTSLIVIVALISGLAVTFSEVLGKLIEGERPLVEGSLGTYLIQLPVELFETLVSLLSNTLSYVRVGAFAVAHASLSLVMFLLADMVSPDHNVVYWTVIALGNLFVFGFEGMIVAIQTLRLEYYEFFGKFFFGGGIRHRPLSLIARAEE
ncbi:MAG: hypothetical protein GX620_11120 [Chloroflexi bacterium]|nr:hypothetical protein [Chloroflexota bacterium]